MDPHTLTVGSYIAAPEYHPDGIFSFSLCKIGIWTSKLKHSISAPAPPDQRHALAQGP